MRASVLAIQLSQVGNLRASVIPWCCGKIGPNGLETGESMRRGTPGKWQKKVLTPGIFRALLIELSLIPSCTAHDANCQSISDANGAQEFFEESSVLTQTSSSSEALSLSDSQISYYCCDLIDTLRTNDTP